MLTCDLFLSTCNIIQVAFSHIYLAYVDIITCMLHVDIIYLAWRGRRLPPCLWILSMEGSLSCHTSCDTGPRFSWSHPKNRPPPPPPAPHQIVSPIWRIAFELKHWYMYSYLIKKKIYTQYNVIFLHFVACKCYFWWRRCNEQCWIPWYQEMAMHKVSMDKIVHLKAFLCPCWALGRIRS